MSAALVPPHTSARRAALLEQLIVALSSTAGDSLPIRTRAPDDPTVALLDAWATVGDVIGFYLDRIADEGYLTTAVEPGSILALANLVGHQPLPGLAAQVYVAYTMGPDPTDTAVQFDSGLLFQSVPGAGQQPQTFESANSVLARPSWSLLAPKSGGPVPSDTTQLVVAGTTTNLAPNDVIVVELTSAGSGTGSAAQVTVSVAAVAIDYTNQVTNVTLQAPAVAPPQAPPPPPTPPPTDVEGAIDSLLTGGLADPTNAVPESANQLPRAAGSVFTQGSDAVPRLLSTLQPAVGATLYRALDTTAIGTPDISSATQLQVVAAPFGATAPPQNVFDASGKPAGTRPWPIADTFTLSLTVTEGDFARLWQRVAPPQPPRWLNEYLRRAGAVTHDPAVQVTCTVGTIASEATIDMQGGSGQATPSGFGEVSLSAAHGASIGLSYAGYTPTAAPATPDTPATAAFVMTATIDPNTDALTLDFGALGTQTWDPDVSPFIGQLGDSSLSIAWSSPPEGEATLTFSIATPLPLADLKQLLLDTTYGGIVPDTTVVIETAGDPAATVITQVTAVNTVGASAYGISGKVTSLTLQDDWITADAVLQTALQTMTVYAQPAALTLKPAPITDDVAGASIELATLVAGIEPGRLIAVTGTRTDLPAGATVPSGEIAMVQSVTNGADGGDTTYSTLNLSTKLAYTYQRSTVQIYGNVVAAHQGATINQVLGSGQPAQAPQTFTLSGGPLLADPAAVGSGSQSTLTVTVGGVGYAPVERFDATTSPQSYVLGTDVSGNTTITFPASLPAGSANVNASYRAGDGSQGNVQAGQISQLLSRPAGLSAVINPLPATGGSPGDTQESVRTGIPLGLSGLGRIVTVSDYAALASSFAGVAMASAGFTAHSGVTITIAGSDPVPLDPAGALCTGVALAITQVADPTVPMVVVPATLYLIAITADVISDPLVGWDATVAAVQGSLFGAFGYSQRELGQAVSVSDVVAAAHTAPGVLSFTVTGLALVPITATASQLSTLLPHLLATSPVPVASVANAGSAWSKPPPARGPAQAPAAAIAFMSAADPDTLILTQQSP